MADSRRDPGPRRHVGRGLSTARREWVGGRFAAPVHVTGEATPYRPTLVAWIEIPEGLVVGNGLAKPTEEHGALGRTLADAMLRPLVGAARRPSSIRVADADLADEVKAVVGDLIPVTIAPTPELDELANAMFDSFTKGTGGGTSGSRGDEDPSYFENGRVSPAVVADLFAAARLLRHAAPWKIASDQHVLRLDIPELGVEGACVSIIGALGQNFGLLIFPSLARYERFLDAAARPRRKSSRIDVGTSWLSLTLVPRAELPSPMRHEVAEHAWPIVDESSYPLVEHRERDGILRPLVDRDVRIASACATSLSAFFVRNHEEIADDDGEPICQSFTDDEGRIVRFTLPYEAFPLFDIGADPRSASAAPRTSPLGRNDPCRCGSGKKYKSCHLDEDRLPK